MNEFHRLDMSNLEQLIEGFDRDRIAKAYRFATEAHEGQLRKYTGEPYVIHPMTVSLLVLKFGGDENMMIAALLHDTVEDTSVTIEQIEEEFGSDVAMLVGWLTDVSKPEHGNRETRKRLDREHTAKADPRAKTIKLADLIHNTISIVEHDKAFARVFLPEKRLLLGVLGEGDQDLFALANRLLIECFDELGG